MLSEDIHTELKEIYVNDVKKEVVAFANTEGGSLYIGVSDNGKIIGVDDPDHVMTQTAAALKDGIRPDVMPFVRISNVLSEGKQVIKIEVAIGTNKPYYLSDKGLRPSGVYVRKGSSSQPVSDEAIRELILRTSGKSYETSRSMNQELSFVSFIEKMKERKLEAGLSQFKTLHLIGEDGLYTNLALLLSDQCEHTLKLAVFQGTDKAVFRDRKEFTGSILKQLNDLFEAIDLYNKTKSSIVGLYRTDKRDYDEEALREALLNCIVHRDYSFSASTLINVYDDRIEFVSLGGLVKGLTMEAILMGVSQSRNPNLAAVFYRMKLIESYGTGIGKILRAYKDYPFDPIFESADGAFRLTLPNMNESKQAQPSSDAGKLILEHIKQNGSVNRPEVERITGLKTTAAHNLLKRMCADHKIMAVGKGKSTKYISI